MDRLGADLQACVSALDASEAKIDAAREVLDSN